ncbi:hypothetical protein BWX42_00625 [Dolosigranulum pigrum]|uniref:Uncharacterized protein n=1 Tax=Dolosigranulum pigrum TaxID=29394 RepID=A0A1S8KL58_9LACT|nr:hypothetical protein BWX42_00245 [Dolosigranulum pigrum]OOL80489.1 hypothetical protein BWX42_00625 [Dolosigranulum pigrum]
MTKFLSNLHLNQNQLIKAVLQNSGTEPQSAVKGQVFFDTTVNRLKVYDGEKWVSSALTGNEVVALVNQASTKIKTSQIDGFNEALGEISMSGADIVEAINAGDTSINADKVQYEASKSVKQALQEALTATGGIDGKVSNAKQDALREAKEYSDSKIDELINGAPGDLDTLKEIADMLSANKDIIETLKGATKKYAETIGDGVATEHTVTHNLNTRDVVVTIHENQAPYEVVLADIEVTDTNSVLVRTAQAVEQDALKVVVIG